MQFKKGVWIIAMCFMLMACASSRMAEELQAGKSSFQTGDYKQAFHQLLPLAVKGKAEAQYAVGYLYYYGYGVPEDTESGLFWMTKAAEQHYPPAMQAIDLIHQHPIEAQSPIPTREAIPYEKRRDEILKTMTASPTLKKTAYYSLQLYGSHRLTDVKGLQTALRLKNTGHIYETTYKGKNWYVLTFGNFITAQEAAETQHNLPTDLKNMRPWVRGVNSLRLV